MGCVPYLIKVWTIYKEKQGREACLKKAFSKKIIVLKLINKTNLNKSLKN